MLKPFEDIDIIRTHLARPAKFGPYGSWIAKARLDLPQSSNQGSDDLPFQRWFKFKEAFSPELIRAAFSNLNSWPKTALDPFGGCGTTALTCQFLGIEPSIIEINPFLADLSAAKLTTYDLSKLQRDYSRVFQSIENLSCSPEKFLSAAPSTLIPKKGASQWVFPTDVMKRILEFGTAIESLTSAKHRRLFKVLLGSVLVDVSNVTVNGKGRKYRSNWQVRQKEAFDVDERFEKASLRAFEDIARFGVRPEQRFRLRRGDSRSRIGGFPPADVVFCSPPYPNSFDYTDIYNLELWVLGYLKNRSAERKLRQATLRSHVQVGRTYPKCGIRTPTLTRTVNALTKNQIKLWSKHIPPMIEGYFNDLSLILTGLRSAVVDSGSLFFVLGDSSYAGITVRSAKIFSELAARLNFEVVDVELLRGLRKSAQQGGRIAMQEHLVHLISHA